MADMRTLIQIVENARDSERLSRRLWVAPDGGMQTLEDGASHSRSVMNSPARFGLDAEKLAYLSQWWADNELEFDYEYVIAAAQSKGWVRVSSDATNIAISGSNRHAMKSVARSLADKGYNLDPLQLEISVLRMREIFSSYYVLQDEAVDRFLLRGVLPKGQTNTIPVELPPGFHTQVEQRIDKIG